MIELLNGLGKKIRCGTLPSVLSVLSNEFTKITCTDLQYIMQKPIRY